MEGRGAVGESMGMNGRENRVRGVEKQGKVRGRREDRDRKEEGEGGERQGR